MTSVATCRCVLGVFRIDPIFKTENRTFRITWLAGGVKLGPNIPCKDRTKWYRSRDPSPATPGTLVITVSADSFFEFKSLCLFHIWNIPTVLFLSSVVKPVKRLSVSQKRNIEPSINTFLYDLCMTFVWPFVILLVVILESRYVTKAFGLMKRCTSSEV